MINECLSAAQNSEGFYDIRGRAVQPLHIPQGLRVLWYREAQPAMIKEALMPEGFDPAIRQYMCATLFLKQLLSYTILSYSALYGVGKPALIPVLKESIA
jgi:hypothetical protein